MRSPNHEEDPNASHAILLEPSREPQTPGLADRTAVLGPRYAQLG